ncbi:MAG: hypothetical protein BA861_01685 [Desulfobacterales bacterium S3730MH5]|nr:MAG: hypothetical protein BA861_01685 [Desulfobacterales bacterium S3730MH5]
MLFPGDLTDWTYLIARRFPDLSADIFKYPHHGSSGPGISRKAFRHFGHPFPHCCPCGPWCHPECCDWHHEYWYRLEKRIAIRDACRFHLIRNGPLFDNSLNEKGFRIDIRMENGYEEGCTRGARLKTEAQS